MLVTDSKVVSYSKSDSLLNVFDFQKGFNEEQIKMEGVCGLVKIGPNFGIIEKKDLYSVLNSSLKPFKTSKKVLSSSNYLIIASEKEEILSEFEIVELK